MASMVGVGDRDHSHLEKRMEDRDCTEIDLRAMLEQAQDYSLDVVEGRWVIATRHRQQL